MTILRAIFSLVKNIFCPEIILAYNIWAFISNIFFLNLTFIGFRESKISCWKKSDLNSNWVFLWKWLYITHIYTGPFTLKNWWFFKIRANSESNGLYSLIVVGVSFEESAFEVSNFPYKSSRRHVDCDVLAWNANFKMAISCPVFDRILKVRPFLNSENFKLSEYLKIW
jgi:hypothetical protein